MHLFLPDHPIQYLLELRLHLAVYYSVSQHLRLDVLKSQGLLVEGRALDDFNVLVANNWLYRVVRLVVNHFLNRWHVFGAECLHEDIDGGRILYFVDLVGSLRHNHIFILIGHVHPFFLLIVLLLVLVLLVVVLVCLKYELFSPVVGRNLLQLPVPLELLRSPQHLHIFILFLAVFVLLKVGLFRHLVELNLSLHPRMVVYLLPRYSAFSLLCKESFQQIIEIGGEEFYLRSFCSLGKRSYVMEAGGYEWRIALC